MEVILEKKPKNPIIIEGFPGFGLVGTIATEFLMNNLETEQIGKIYIDEMPAIVAIHNKKIVQPFGIFYNKKHNLVIMHAITSVQGIEWDITDAIIKLAEEMKAKEIISIEAVGSRTAKEETDVYYYSNSKKRTKELKDLKIEPLKEGIIMGITGTLLLKAKDIMPISCLFAESHSNLPDSRAAAKTIEVINDLLHLEIDTKPLIAQADQFEKKLQTIMEQSEQMSSMSKAKKPNYFG